MGAARIGAHADETRRRTLAEDGRIELLGSLLAGLEHQPVLGELFEILWDAVALDVGSGRVGDRVQAAELYDLQIGIGGPDDLHGGVR